MDHDPRCLKYIGEQLASNEQDVHVSLLLAPLVVRKFVDRQLPAYHLPKDEVLGQGAADLIIVAGPPAMLTNREGTLYQMMDFARPGTLIVLPDSDRLEKEALARWRNRYDGAASVGFYTDFRTSLMTITVVKPVRAKDLPKYEMDLVVRALRRLIQPGANWIVVDDGRLAANTFAGHCVHPFLERNGEYCGRPSTSSEAISEVEHLRQSVAYIPCFRSVELLVAGLLPRVQATSRV